MNASKTDQPDVSPKLLQENAEKLAKLEPDWSELGPWRQIDYHCRFPDEGRAETFCAKAKEAGFETSVPSRGGGVYLITASVRIEPTAFKITLLQEQLKSFLEFPDDFGEDYSYVDGWSYPPKKRVHFWPSSDNEDAVKNRAAVLFGSELVEDPLEAPLSRCLRGLPWNGLHSRRLGGEPPHFKADNGARGHLAP